MRSDTKGNEMTLPQQFSEPWAAGPDDPYRIEPCPECGAADMEYGEHEPGCPSGYPVRNDDEIGNATREYEDENHIGPF